VHLATTNVSEHYTRHSVCRRLMLQAMMRDAAVIRIPSAWSGGEQTINHRLNHTSHHTTDGMNALENTSMLATMHSYYRQIHKHKINRHTKYDKRAVEVYQLGIAQGNPSTGVMHGCDAIWCLSFRNWTSAWLRVVWFSARNLKGSECTESDTRSSSFLNKRRHFDPAL